MSYAHDTRVTVVVPGTKPPGGEIVNVPVAPAGYAVAIAVAEAAAVGKAVAQALFVIVGQSATSEFAIAAVAPRTKPVASDKHAELADFCV